MLHSLADDELGAEAPASRRAPGRPWKPGQSGNPGGKPRRTMDGKSLPELAREHTGEALRTLASIIANPKELTPNRIAAANVILQRGWGDAPRDLSAGETIRFIIETINPANLPDVPGVLNTPVCRTREDDPNTADSPERAPPRPRFIGYDAHVLNHDGPAERGVGWVPPETREAES